MGAFPDALVRNSNHYRYTQWQPKTLRDITMAFEIDTGTDHLLATLDEGVLTLTLNRPEARNAMSRELVGALSEQLKAAEQNVDVRCIVLTGAGSVSYTHLTLPTKA